ncbi:Endochitinase B1 [Penicillium diatomitis]|uniref:chitinase n=1 Tax=Penicillium diatomitis TaxID=2819901 RepID=A0A9W9WR82_9EURO|nr:Endochitinase B1 [Penicillium diatomitis]KAJ5472031.1 Endochitinase B1 [Penicillium diatomitis]
MRFFFYFILSCFVTVHINAISQSCKTYRSVAYYTNWSVYGRKFNPQDLQTDQMTHVLYAFANIDPNTGGVYLSDKYADVEMHFSTDSWNDLGINVYGCVKQLYLLKKKNRNLKVLLSVGGWTYSSNFKKALSTASGRATFASSCTDIVKKYGFDGIDVDWEYPETSDEALNLVAALKELRSTSAEPNMQSLDQYASLKANHYRFLITVACPAGAKNYQALYISDMSKYVDFWNLMAYDYSGSWSPVAGHTANVYTSTEIASSTPYNTDQAIEYYISRGISAESIVLGMPLFGRSFMHTDGPGHPYQGVGDGSWEKGAWDYKALPLAGSTVHDLEQPIASYSYDPLTKMMVSYDTPKTATQKADYVIRKGLGGGMWWEASSDKEGSESLIASVINKFGGVDALEHVENQLSYPESPYDNLRT